VGSRRDCTWILGLPGFRVVAMEEAEGERSVQLEKQLTNVFHIREAKSVTAEFTPRVRKDGHPNFTSGLQSILNKTPQGALLVRVTGQLMFDSEHFHQLHLNRATQWKIHPIMKLEFCPKGKTCKKDSNENWVDLDSQ
jgi:hypothetical protein